MTQTQSTHLVVTVNRQARTLCGIPYTPDLALARNGEPTCPNCRHVDEQENAPAMRQTPVHARPERTDEQSHYLPAFTEANGPKRRAACGKFIRIADHSTEPTCPTCQAWLTEDEQSFQETLAAQPELAAYFPFETKGGR